MSLPSFPKELQHLKLAQEVQTPSVLNPTDDEYLTKMVEGIRAGKPAIIIMEDEAEKLKYMFSNTSRAISVSMMGKVIEAVGRRIDEGGSSRC